MEATISPPELRFIVTLLREINGLLLSLALMILFLFCLVVGLVFLSLCDLVILTLSLSFDFVLYASESLNSLSSLSRSTLPACDLESRPTKLIRCIILKRLRTISLDRLDILKEDLFVHEHVVMNPTSVGIRHLHLYMNPKIKQLAIKRVDEYGFVDSKNLLDMVSSSKRGIF
ncbi:hypothetical protein Tco_1312333 [Tanacetum coccineum]